MTALKKQLEAATVNAPMHVYEIYIRATPERIWQALTDSELVKRYYFGSVIESDFQPGSPIIYKQPDTGRIDYANEGAADQLGAPAEALMGTLLADHLRPGVARYQPPRVRPIRPRAALWAGDIGIP